MARHAEVADDVDYYVRRQIGKFPHGALYERYETRPSPDLLAAIAANEIIVAVLIDLLSLERYSSFTREVSEAAASDDPLGPIQLEILHNRGRALLRETTAFLADDEADESRMTQLFQASMLMIGLLVILMEPLEFDLLQARLRSESGRSWVAYYAAGRLSDFAKVVSPTPSS